MRRERRYVVKNYPDAVRMASDTYGYTKKRIVEDHIVIEVNPEDVDGIRKYEFVDGGVVPQGVPIGVKVCDHSMDEEPVLFLYDGIRGL
jgi:hypothetical protein